jgi:hypothetical protein
MCALFGSYNKDKFLELLEINSYRGSFSYSYAIIHNDYSIVDFKDFGTFDKVRFNEYADNAYFLGHVQSPTAGLERNYSRIHPAIKNTFRLWHNGIIKAKHVEEMQRKLDSDNMWDTQLLLDTVITDNILNPLELSNIDGAFSCALLNINVSLMLFRNTTSPLFYNDSLDISSTKFVGSEKTHPNIVYNMDLTNRTMSKLAKFENINTPYYFAGENGKE